MQMAQMRALENGRYVIRSTNNGITGVINPQGVIEAQIPQFVSAILHSQVTAYTGTTPYTRWGSAPTLVLVSLGLLLLLWRSRR
jgi:apolipoprotein N-acyltransferase